MRKMIAFVRNGFAPPTPPRPIPRITIWVRERKLVRGKNSFPIVFGTLTFALAIFALQSPMFATCLICVCLPIEVFVFKDDVAKSLAHVIQA